MKKLASFFSVFFVLFILSFVFTSCQEEVLEQALEKSEIVIKMSLPDGSQGDLKSAVADQVIGHGDTIDILNLKNVNIVFSAEDESGKSLAGDWMIYLADSDNNTDNQRLAERPSTSFWASNIASIKPSELGLYMIHFQAGKTWLMFFLRHTGLPGDIGDEYQNGYAFRMEKKLIHDDLNQGKIKTAYTLYLRVNENEFKSWGTYDGTSPNNKELWQALLFCGGENSFTISTGITYSAKNFKLREAKYSKNIYLNETSYYCFTFFPEDTPPSDRLGGGKSYQVQFYAGEYAVNWWTFPSNDESAWKRSSSDKIEFVTF